MPTTCRECGTPLHRDEEEVVWRCENPSCPARIRAQPGALRVAIGDEHRRARRVAGRSAASSRISSATSPTSITSIRAQLENLVVAPQRPEARIAPSRASSARSAGNVVRRAERSKSKRRVPARSTRSASATSARKRRPRWRATSVTSIGSSTATVEELQTAPEIGPVVAGVGPARLRASRVNQALVTKLKRRGRQDDDRSARTGDRTALARWWGRRSC